MLIRRKLLIAAMLIVPLISHGQTSKMTCSGRAARNGTPINIEIEFSKLPRSTLKQTAFQSDGKIVTVLHPSDVDGTKYFPPVITDLSIVYCYVASFHGNNGKACTEVDRIAGKFEAVNYDVWDGKTERSLVISGLCQVMRN